MNNKCWNQCHLDTIKKLQRRKKKQKQIVHVGCCVNVARCAYIVSVSMSWTNKPNRIEKTKKTGNFYLCINFESISTWRTNCPLSIHALDVIYFRLDSYGDDNNLLCAISNMFVYKMCVLNVDDFSMIEQIAFLFFHLSFVWQLEHRLCACPYVCVYVCESNTEFDSWCSNASSLSLSILTKQ